MGEVKIEFQENNIRGRIFVLNLSSCKKFLTKTSANNMWEVKFEFQENIINLDAFGYIQLNLFDQSL